MINKQGRIAKDGPGVAAAVRASQLTDEARITALEQVSINPALQSVMFDDFLGGSSAGDFAFGWAAANFSTAFATIDAGHPGIVTIHTTNSPTGLGRISSNGELRFGGGEWSIETLCYPVLLSIAAEEFALYVGFADNPTAGTPATDGAYFEYDRAKTFSTPTGDVTINSAQITGVSSTVGLVPGMPISGTGIPASTTILSVTATTINLSAQATATNAGVTLTILQGDLWVIRTANNGGVGSEVNRTRVMTTVAVTAATWFKLKIVVNAAATLASFYINGVLVGTISTNIPTASGRETAEAFYIQKSNGGTQRNVHFDYWLHKVALTTPR